MMLSWLPEHPDLGRALSEAREIADPVNRLRAAIRLSGHDRDMVATGRIYRLAAAELEVAGLEGVEAAGLTPLRVSIMSSHSVDHLVPSICVAGLNRGMALSVHLGTYGLYRQALLNGDPDLASFDPQIVLLALDMAAVLPTLPLAASQAEVDVAVAAVVEDVRQLWHQIRQRYGAEPVQQTILDQTLSLFGSFDGLVPTSPAALRARLNAALRTAAREDGALLLDVDWQLPPISGENELVDPVRWHQAKQLVNPIFAPIYGDLVARVAAAVGGRSRKCLVLDLDNTLWGGVIGDDGIEGIKLGQGSAEGEAFLAFQRYVARLAERGIILAVCSKNDDAVARSAFEGHPDMALRLTDIACFVANWTDKATNLREIARSINIGTDSLVFVDDNPAERDIVRRELPEVAVPELPDDVSHYAARIAQAGYFEAVSLTGDDLERSRSYAANVQREAALHATTDMDGYLQSLKMRLTARTIVPMDRPRAAQLINKSNQFNLTTRRRTEQELETMLDDPSVLGYGFRLSDRFGDNGLISIVLARPDRDWPVDTLLIDTWLMSCRVLGRGVEAAALVTLADVAAQHGVSALIGEYRPSGRNAMVQSHYEQLGFKPVAGPPAGNANTHFWRLTLADAVLPSHRIAVDLIT